MIIQENTQQLAQFRLEVYQNFTKRADTLMDLIDALSGNNQARSVVQLSLSTSFRRDYTSLSKAISEYQTKKATKTLAQLAGPYLTPPIQRPFWLIGVDVTPQPRPYATRLDDRGYVYQPNPIRSNKPITIGHQYSSVFALPERTSQQSKTWVVPLSTQRVKSSDDKELIGAEQIRILLEDENLPFHRQLCAEVADSSYSKPAYLHANRSKANLVTLVRVRSNRTFFRQPEANRPSGQCGHPTWFGAGFSLRDSTTQPAPDEQATTTFTSKRGRVYTVKIDAWYDLLMRGERNPKLIPMQNYPFTLVRICLYNPDGELVFKNPMWLIVVGEKRRLLSLVNIFEAYHQRYDLEHFFRFGKQKLLLNHFQTPETLHEENWWQLAHLAYLQLWVARSYASSSPRPWERSLPIMKDPIPSPTSVQRDFERIIRPFGSPANFPKHRGKSPGRAKGSLYTRREPIPVVFKGKS
ncbi:MAG: transposase [Chloroflexota bacterium]